MAVKVDKLWRNGAFKSFDNNSKILYIYLISNPSINSVGVIILDPQDMIVDLKMKVEQLRSSIRSLQKANFTHVFKHGEVIYFIVTHHYDSLPRSLAVKRKADKEFKMLPLPLQQFLESKNIASEKIIDLKGMDFTPPTAEEVAKFAISKGHYIDAHKFIKHYADNNWRNRNNRYVRNWRATAEKVWFKDENKVPKGKNAPKGMEYFYILKDDKIIPADHWRNNRPYSTNYPTYNRLLLKEYEKIRGDIER